MTLLDRQWTCTDLVPVAGQLPAATDDGLIQAFMATPKQAVHGERNRLARWRALRALSRFLPCPLLGATESHIGAWLGRPIAAATRVTILSHLHAFYDWAQIEGLIDRSPTLRFRGRAGDDLTIASVPAPIEVDETRVAVVLAKVNQAPPVALVQSPSTQVDEARVAVNVAQVAPSVEIYRVTLELGVCEACGDQDDRLRRLGGIGAPLCPTCYQRAKRAARKAGEALRDASRRTTAADLRSELLARGLAARTITGYMNTIWSAERWFDARGLSLARATPEQIAAYAGTTPLSHSTRITLRASLGHYWAICGHPRPPTGAVRVPSQPTMVSQALEEEDCRALVRVARARGDRPGFAVLLGMYQALRREEIATLPWSAFDEAPEGYMTVTGKGSKTRTIPVHSAILGVLEPLLRTDHFIFPGRRPGTSVCPATIWYWVRLVSMEAGLPPVRAHQLRHSALSTANDATGDLRAVQALAGHAKPETTAGYTRASRHRLEAAVAAIDY